MQHRRLLLLLVCAAFLVPGAQAWAGVAPSHPDLGGEDAGRPETAVPAAPAGLTDVKNLDTLTEYPTIEDALNDPATLDGHTLEVQVASHFEGIVTVDKEVTIQGMAGGAAVLASTSTTSSGDGRGWFLVTAPNVTVRDLDFDGNGMSIYQAFRLKSTAGGASFEDCSFNDISFSTYVGNAVVAIDCNMSVVDCTFSLIRRHGIFFFGTGCTAGVASGNVYTGKGAGDHLDFGVEVGGGAVATLTDNTITDCTGVAVSDGSTSAGVLASTFFGAGTTANLSGNFLNGNTTGCYIGYDGADVTVAAVSDNDLSGNASYGMVSTPTTLTSDASGNWWGSNVASTVAASVSGDVDYTPWLDDGTDTDGGTPGFQGDFSTLNVDDDSPQVGATGRVQEGVNLVTGSTVNVLPGVYSENIVLDESVTLNGAQAGVAACGRVIGASPDTTESVLTAASGIILELENGCAGSTIDGFAIDGMGVAANGIRSNGGPLDDLTFQNNFIGNTTSSGVFLNDSGEDITFFQNEVDGAITGGGGVVHLDQDNFDGFHFVDNCVLNTTAGTGLFVDGDHNIGVSGARSPLLDGNLFDNNATGANLGRFAFEFGDITDNTFSNSEFDGLQGGIQNTEITGNVFTDNDRYGLALTGFGGSGDPTRGAQDLDINNNEFTGNATAGLLFNPTQFPGTISTNVANNNNFTGNAVGATYSGSETIDVSCNWWNDIGGPDAPPGNPNAAGDDATGSFVYWPWLDAAAPGGVCNQFGDDIVAAVEPSECISTVNPCLTVPVVFDRTDTTPARGVSVTFELSPELELCSTPAASIMQGSWLGAYSNVYQVIDNGGGSYTVDQSVLGGTVGCGPDSGGTLFTVDVTNSGGDGTGTITVTAVDVRDCGNPFALLPGIPGPPADVEIDNTLPSAIANLAAAQVKAGNDADGTTEITLTWSPVEAGATVEVYRKGFGFYPEYDDDGGFEPAAPATPALAVGAGWTPTGVALSGDTDETNTERDFYYYVAFVTDECGNVSAVSNKTGGTLNYHLGDFVPVPTFGNNEVDIDDISKLGFHYGTQDGDALYLDTLDVGPTSDNSTDGLPETDNLIQFEDLIITAINFGQVFKPGPAPGGKNVLTLEVPELPEPGGTFTAVLAMNANGAVQGLSVPLVWDASVVQPVGYASGALLDAQAGFGALFSPAPGTVDAAVFGSSLTGEGILATVTFRVQGAGDPAIGFGEVLARDGKNRPVDLKLATEVKLGDVRPLVTHLLPAAPNPFLGSTLVRFAMAEDGPVSIRIYSVDGRLVRTLLNEVVPSGERSVAWDGADDTGRPVASGSYLVRFAAPTRAETQRVVRIQ